MNMPNVSDPSWLLWQLADSAFPTGGFAHSAGLEAMMQAGEIVNAEGLEQFLRDSIHQAGWAFLPLANSGYDFPELLPELDLRCDSFLTNHVANRASRIQGRAFLSACEKAFPIPTIMNLSEDCRERKSPRHFAPLWGVALKGLDVPRLEMQKLALFITFRGVLSAGVRLGLVGPFQAQQIQFRLAEEMQVVLNECRDLTADSLAQVAPLLDLFQSTHDRLYSRLFQS